MFLWLARCTTLTDKGNMLYPMLPALLLMATLLLLHRPALWALASTKEFLEGGVVLLRWQREWKREEEVVMGTKEHDDTGATRGD